MFTRASKNEKQVSSLPMRRGKKQQLFEQRRLQRNKLTLAGIDYNSIKKNKQMALDLKSQIEYLEKKIVVTKIYFKKC